MKLGAIYTIFNGLELLEGSIRQIENYVDKVFISWQGISNRGETTTQTPDRFIHRQRELLTYAPDLTLNTKENERRKFNNAIQHLKRNGFTHFILLACDHYYKPEEFIRAIEKGKDFDVSVTSMFTYFKHPTWRLIPRETYFMPFICNIHPETAVDKTPYSQAHTDPSVRINTRKSFYIFKEDEIMLHHFSAVRYDIFNKYRNSASGIRWTPEQLSQYEKEFNSYDLEKNEGIAYFDGRKIEVVDNYFNISVNALPLEQES